MSYVPPQLVADLEELFSKQGGDPSLARPVLGLAAPLVALHVSRALSQKAMETPWRRSRDSWRRAAQFVAGMFWTDAEIQRFAEKTSPDTPLAELVAMTLHGNTN